MTIVCLDVMRAVDGIGDLSALFEDAVLPASIRRAWVGCPASGSVNAGELICRAEFDSWAGWRAWRDAPFWSRSGVRAVLDRITDRDRAVYALGDGGSRQDGDGAVWRGLVFAVRPDAPPLDVGRLEAGLLSMPAHIGEIRSWRLSRVVEASGARRWTHVWEQEFDRAEDLRGPYLSHPVHWSHVDGWFDVECPQGIVDPHLIHALAAVDGAISL